MCCIISVTKRREGVVGIGLCYLNRFSNDVKKRKNSVACVFVLHESDWVVLIVLQNK